MTTVLLFFIIISILLLLGFLFYVFLSKTPKNAKTKLRCKIALCKILQIEFESKYDNN